MILGNFGKKIDSKKCQIWLGQHDALCDPSYMWCNPYTVSLPTQCTMGVLNVTQKYFILKLSTLAKI